MHLYRRTTSAAPAQLAALTTAGTGKMFRGAVSGAKTDRSHLRQVFDQLASGDHHLREGRLY